MSHLNCLFPYYVFTKPQHIQQALCTDITVFVAAFIRLNSIHSWDGWLQCTNV